jgi:hypothetical protein
MDAVGPWVQDCLRLMDSDGAYIKYKESGELADQSELDMKVFDCIKSKWCEMRNKEMESKYGKQASGHN